MFAIFQSVSFTNVPTLPLAALGDVGLALLQLLLFLLSLFLILLILIQRGKGGGLSGALGGGGGESAFGSKAGDAFTKITVGTAMLWITLCMLTIAMFNPPERNFSQRDADDEVELEAEIEEFDAENSGSIGAIGGDTADGEAEANSSDDEATPAGGTDAEPATDTAIEKTDADAAEPEAGIEQ